MQVEHHTSLHSRPGNHNLSKLTIKSFLSHLLEISKNPHLFICLPGCTHICAIYINRNTHVFLHTYMYLLVYMYTYRYRPHYMQTYTHIQICTETQMYHCSLTKLCSPGMKSKLFTTEDWDSFTPFCVGCFKVKIQNILGIIMGNYHSEWVKLWYCKTLNFLSNIKQRLFFL